MPLKLNLRAHERFILNGAVVSNGDRRTTLTLENGASILRERDIMTAEQATSPARRVYFACMLAYIDPGDERHRNGFVDLLGEFMAAIANPAARLACVEASKSVLAGDYYRALLHCRSLIDYEDRVLGVAPAAEAA
ncbi:MAG: flagellar biosynthesis repressor FlbT [Alphaproteobacteria bacterium]|nr:flagellar biosynthesis repressor FlbT [Alphaproteobacteria bacterium]